MHRPFARVTLSRRRLGLEEKWGVSCQVVLAKRGKGRRKGNEGIDKGGDVVEPGGGGRGMVGGTKRKSESELDDQGKKRRELGNDG